MKTLWKSVRITVAFCIFFSVFYILVLWIFAQFAGPNKGNAEVLTLNGKAVGAANVGQMFTEDGKCMVRVKITGEVTEIDREVMKILRVEEKRVRRSYGTDDVYADEPSDSTPTLLSLDAIPSEEREASAWLMDPSDFTKETAFNAGVSDFLKYLTANQQRVFIECFLKGQSYKEYAEENGIRAQSVQETAKYVKRKAKKFFKKF